MKCESFMNRQVYEHVARFETSEIILYLRYWNCWLARSKFPKACTIEQQEETLRVAALFGSSTRSLSLAAKRFNLRMPSTMAPKDDVPSSDSMGEDKQLAITSQGRSNINSMAFGPARSSVHPNAS